MANKVEMQEGEYSIVIKRIIPKTGANILDKNGNLVFSLFNSEDGKGIVLGEPNIPFSKLKEQRDIVNALTKEEVSEIFKLGRRVASELNRDFVASKHVLKKLDVLNFVQVGNDRFSAMTHDEMKLLGDIPINVKMPHEKAVYNDGRETNLIMDRFSYDIIRYNTYENIKHDELKVPDNQEVTLDINGSVNLHKHSRSNYKLNLISNSADYSKINIIDSVGIDREYNMDSMVTLFDKDHKQDIILKYNSDNVDNFQFPPEKTKHLAYHIAPEDDKHFGWLAFPSYDKIKQAQEDGYDVSLDINNIMNNRRTLINIGVMEKKFNDLIKNNPEKLQKIYDGIETFKEYVKDNPHIQYDKPQGVHFITICEVIEEFQDEVKKQIDKVREKGLEIG